MKFRFENPDEHDELKDILEAHGKLESFSYEIIDVEYDYHMEDVILVLKRKE